MRKIAGPMVALLLGVGIGVATAGDGLQAVAGSSPVQPPPPPSGASESSNASTAVDASSVLLPCIPVAAYWTGPPQSEGMPPGPELAVVSTDIRPKDARLYLDDRFVGRARYLDGRPGYLYLEPGAYHLELRLDGYQTLALDLTAEAGCRFDLKHRLQRVKGTAREKTSDGYGKGKPFNRVFSPEKSPEQVERGLAAGPDPALRPDLGAETSKTTASSQLGAALKLSVKPASATVAIDGKFVATATELDRMEGPLAVSVGNHVIEFAAPGHETALRNVELNDGDVIELSVDLALNAGESR